MATYILVNYSGEERKYSRWNWKGFFGLAVFSVVSSSETASSKQQAAFLPEPSEILQNFFFPCFWGWHMTCISDGGLWLLSGTRHRWQTCFLDEIIPWLKTCASICNISLMKLMQKTVMFCIEIFFKGALYYFLSKNRVIFNYATFH